MRGADLDLHAAQGLLPKLGREDTALGFVGEIRFQALYGGKVFERGQVDAEGYVEPQKVVIKTPECPFPARHAAGCLDGETKHSLGKDEPRGCDVREPINAVEGSLCWERSRVVYASRPVREEGFAWEDTPSLRKHF